ncbi:hypothetical protein GGR53DRAFT_291611 [Hypoxylon sp. FL1150]|nr:hypothetical protein GGR53DRAFT_291611 [Hypoxylon sp. FL1150]
MKGPVARLCVFFFAAGALAAPIAIQSDAPTNVQTDVREAAQQAHVLPKPLLLSLFGPSRVSMEKHPKFLITEDGQRIQVPDHLAGAKSWETPNVLHFLTSLTHTNKNKNKNKKQSPFPESSIMKEETSANSAETEPQETIVELETKAERESWTYIPYISKDNVLHFRCVRKAADTVMVAVPMVALVAIFLALGTALRYALRCSFGSCKHGSVRLSGEARHTPTRLLIVACRSCTIKSTLNPDSSQSILSEKSEET